jgi:ferredoxin
MRVAVDVSKCLSSGQCVLIAPEVFDQSEDDGTVLLLEETPGPDRWDRVREAAFVCPSGAITVTES